MKNHYRFILFLLIGLLLACQSDDTSTPPEDQDNAIPKILMIGNSHTYYFDLPLVVQKIAASMGDSTMMESLTKGGAGFKDHVEGYFNQQEIQSEKWDYVVLQEAGGLSAREMEFMEVESYPYAKTLIDWIRGNSLQTKIYYYMTHAYRDGAPWCDQDPLVCDFDGMLNEIRRNFIYLEDNTAGIVSPAGIVWKILRNQVPNIDLHDPDTIHPNELGSYVSACTIYVSLFQKQLTNQAFKPEGVEQDLANTIHKIVNETVLDGMPDWRVY